MAKEFDIYLRKRVHECDLIVLSLPFRDGLTVTNRMILESCVKSYLLYEFAAVQSGVDIASHIDEMLKICYEMLSFGTHIGISAEFQTHYSFYPNENIIELGSSDIPMLATMFTEAESAMLIGASPLLVSIGKSLGYGSSEMDLDVNLPDVLKQSVLTLKSEMAFYADVLGTNETDFISVTADIIPSANIVDLCYRVTRAGSTAMEIAALVLGTEIHFSFGRAFSGVAFGSSVYGSKAQKFEVIENTLSILHTLTESIIQYVEPGAHFIKFGASGSAIVKMHRLLSEMDANELQDYDNMTLDEVDFVILT